MKLRQKSGRRLQGAGNVLLSTAALVVRTICSPSLLVALFVGYYLSHHTQYLDKLVAELVKKPSLKKIGEWIRDHKNQAIGAVTLCLTSALALPNKYQLLAVAAGIFAAIEWLPATTTWNEYAALSIGITMWCRARGVLQTVLVTVLLLGIYAYGFAA